MPSTKVTDLNASVFKAAAQRYVEDFKSMIAQGQLPAGMGQPDLSGLRTSVMSVDVDPVSPKTTPKTIYSETFTNNTSSVQTNTFQRSYTEERTTTWNVDVGLKVGVKLDFGATIEIVSAKTEISVEASLDTSVGGSVKDTQLWSFLQPVTVNPGKRVEADAILYSGSATAPFTMRIAVSGVVKVPLFRVVQSGGKPTVEQYWQTYDAVDLLGASPDFTRGTGVDGKPCAIFTCSGTFSGVLGVNAVVDLEER